jgi:hypothetical protein
MTQSIDSAPLILILNDLRLPAIKQGWADFAARADKEGWPAARFLATLAEHEIAERDRRCIERHLLDARLLPGKTLVSFDFEAVPMISKAHVMAICAGDSWIDRGANLILISGPGGGKAHQRCFRAAPPEWHTVPPIQADISNGGLTANSHKGGSSQGPSSVHAVDCGETAKNVPRRHLDGQADLRAQRFATSFRYNLKNARNL